MEPRIQYTKTDDGVNIAYFVMGDGPPLVCLTPGSHLERQWQYPEQREWFTGVSAGARLVRLDHRGTGLSDRDTAYRLDTATLDIEAVVRNERIHRFAMLAQGASSVSAILYASRHPETVSRLVLWCPHANSESFVESSRPLQAVLAALPKDWVTFTQFVAELMTGHEDPGGARRYASYIRDCFTADGYMARLRNFDVTPHLSRLTMPVLVLQRSGASFPTVEISRRITAAVPNARLALFEGSAALPFVGDTVAVVSAIRGFLTEPDEVRPEGLTDRELEILTLLANGASNAEIGRALSISLRTAERHVGNIYLKIDAHNRADATAYAYRRGLVPAS